MSKPQIVATEYNSIRRKVEDILGTTGSASKGYGQRLVSSLVSPGQVITKAQWDNLAYDIVSIRLHQTNTPPVIASIVPGSVVFGGNADNPNVNYDDIIDLATDQRLVNAIGRTVVSAKLNPQRTGAWNNQSQTTFTVIFPGYTRAVDSVVISPVDHARFFFNSGGKIRFTSNRTGGTTSSQNASWTSLLSSTGPQSFQAAVPGVPSFYSLTDDWQIFYQGSASSAYARNKYLIEVKCDIADNTLGGATAVSFRVTWKDDYIDPDIAIFRSATVFTNIYNAVKDNTMIGWIEGIDFTAVQLSAGEISTLKSSINYTPLETVLTFAQLETYKSQTNAVIDSISTTWNDQVTAYLGTSVFVADGVKPKITGSSSPITVDNILYTRDTNRGTASYQAVITTTERTQITTQFTAMSSYQSLGVYEKTLADAIISTFVDAYVTQLQSDNFTVTLYDFKTASIVSAPTFAPSDFVDGTLSLLVEEAKAAGDLAPSGSFDIASPLFSPASITAS